MAPGRSPVRQNEVVPTTLYETMGVTPLCTAEELRRAYRRMVRQLHPDSAGDMGPPDQQAVDRQRITALNRAWRVLSDVHQRAEYDQALALSATRQPDLFLVGTPPAPQSARTRRDAWVLGVRAQVVRLAHQSGKSATQTLLLRSPRGSRATYTEIVDVIVEQIAMDTEARVRAARAAGSTPLDLGVAATLIGVRATSDQIRREASDGLRNELVMAAELLDRMWDVMAHELPVSLAAALGGNPSLARKLLQQAS